jgi:hypothetical protein
MAGIKQIDFWSRVCVEGYLAHILLPCGRVATVDREDLLKCSPYCWNSVKRKHTCYVIGRLQSSPVRALVYLHRLVMGQPDEKLIDHKDFDGLNNRKFNLRHCLPSQSLAHTRRAPSRSGFRGVTFHEKAKKYQAMFAGEHVGLYGTAEEAARARDKEAMRRRGEFAVLNFPRQEAAQ